MSGTSPAELEKPVAADMFKAVMRQVASPVAIITAAHNGHRAGLTATAVCSVSIEPPTVLVCINQHANADALIAQSGAFAVNFLAAEQAGLARLFSTPHLASEARFAGAEWTRRVTGAPLLRAAVGTLDCTVVQMLPSGTHHIYIGRVVAADALDGSPLLYRDGYFRRLAPE